MKTIKELNLNSDSMYLKLEQGENPLRIVSHFVENMRTYDDGSKKLQWSCYVLDRADDSKVKIATFGKSIMKQIQELAMSAEYGYDELPPYDMTVTRTGTGMETRYAVLAARKDTPLTQEEQEEVAEAKNLEQHFKEQEARRLAEEIGGEPVSTELPPL